MLLTGGIGFYLLGWVLPHQTYCRNYTKRLGTVHPVGPLSASAVAHGQWTLRLTRKGWFGEVHTVEVIDANHRLTPNNPINTQISDSYKTAGPREKESRHEFVYDRKGRVVYEVAFDRFGRMDWGFVYAPGEQKDGSRPRSAKAMYLGEEAIPGPRSTAEPSISQYATTNRLRSRIALFGSGRPCHAGPDDAYGHARNTIGKVA